MEKHFGKDVPTRRRWSTSWLLQGVCFVGLIWLLALQYSPRLAPQSSEQDANASSVYGKFPKSHDRFHFLPCTNGTLPPALDDVRPRESWETLFDPDPEHWIWGSTLSGNNLDTDPYARRGIYLCGYIDVPLDYTNDSDSRIVRLGVTKYQVSGLARLNDRSHSSSGRPSERTIVIEPGGPGGSGVSMAFSQAESITQRLSHSQFDVLGWDPRGVNSSQPMISCFPYNADRDRWALLTGQFREVSGSPRAQLEVVDAMNDAIFRACLEVHGDVPRFLSTAFVARDLEEIRKALGEDELTGYLVSYGTTIGQTYANMFPSSVGRLILDGVDYARDHRLLAGFGWTALDNVTDAWHDGFLGECLDAGPDHCALASPIDGQPLTVSSLEERMEALVFSLIDRPAAGYSNFSGPSLVTYSALVQVIYSSLYNAKSWPALAQMLYELEAGNSTLAIAFLEQKFWEYDPTTAVSPTAKPQWDEVAPLVICSDAYDAQLPPNGLDWWESVWANMTAKTWIAGNSCLFQVLPCQHFVDYWPRPAEVYRGHLNQTLRHPVLLISETYDPATPLRNGRKLLGEMGQNARLIIHHGYGHSSKDTSDCTESIVSAFILNGTLPDKQETDCFANEKPYRYGMDNNMDLGLQSPVEIWGEHVRDMTLWGFRSISKT